MTTKEMLDRLSQTFSQGGPVGPKLIPIIEAERGYGDIAESEFKGYSILSHSFFDFFIETVKASGEWCQQKGLPSGCPTYPSVLVAYVTHFWSFRAAENLFRSGYPLDGYALLRDLKDNAMFLAAIQGGLCSFYDIEGWPKGVPFPAAPTKKELSDWKKRRKDAQFNILGQMAGGRSGLPQGVVDELSQWNEKFNWEVHGSRLTYYCEGAEFLKGATGLSLAPMPSELAISTYLNRACEIQWMFVRILPFLQPVKDAFGTKWGEKWTILDESFRQTEMALATKAKAVAEAVVALVDAKFPRTSSICYVER